ncbi:hypothetical protein SEUBUCD646_0L00940 [Saccharomyces eubayanus]|uniref:Uncharacterized protein n=1 Tax=Saccharomyces eubayanus TaxID=1080349 RepID=A0ABN8VJA0_SACEU|nr:hypothetical protein SEUBUCD650_0L00940 [Saccharomyces eubayanus]CAI1593149.1 hypothetical protein SEUBUCD646_0L00940 [Saccharomyces eubayanus]
MCARGSGAVAMIYMDETEVAPLTSQLRSSRMHDLELFSYTFSRTGLSPYYEERARREGEWENLSSVIFVVILPQYIPKHYETALVWSMIIWVKPYCRHLYITDIKFSCSLLPFSFKKEKSNVKIKKVVYLFVYIHFHSAIYVYVYLFFLGG